MIKILAVIAATLLLGACAGNIDRKFKPKTTVRVITSMSYPQFPNIEPLPILGILPFVADLPRDLDAISVKSLTDCIRVKIGKDEKTGKIIFRKLEFYHPDDKPYVRLPKEEQTASWWKACGENPIFPESNIFIGFNQVEWNIILENFAKLRERVWQYKQRIIEINRQRQEWRDKADAERKRLSDANNPKAVLTKSASEPEKEKSAIEKIFD